MPYFDFTDRLITFKENGKTGCLGYLLTLRGKVFDASIGEVDVTEEQAEKHNQVFDSMIIKGLDTCAIGYGHTFYYKPDTKQVITWLGTVIGKASIKAKQVTVYYNEKTFQGNLRKSDDSIFLKRTQ